MKVVLFCGGLGMRLHPTTELVPKPLVPVGEAPIIWHLMKYYSHFGHKDFILCLGYKGEKIKKYFLNHDECLTSDFILTNGGRERKLIEEINDEDWTITFVDTGVNSNIGQRLKAVKKYLDREDVFLANYSDGLADLNLHTLIDFFNKRNKIGCMITVKPFHSYHSISSNDDCIVSSITPLSQSDIRINGGFFVFKNNIFDFIKSNEDLVNESFRRLISKQQLLAFPFDGFWASMDTYKDKQILDDMDSNGIAKWKVWLSNR